MNRRWQWGAAVLLAGLLIGVVAGAAREADDRLAAQLSRLLQAGRKIVSDNQALINDPGKGNKGFTPEAFVDQVLAEYAKTTGVDLRRAAGEDGKVLRLMLDAQRETIADAQAVINMPNMGFKGFVPAVFVRKAAEKFTVQSGLRLKYTASEYRNARNAPDTFERKVLTLFASSAYPKGKAYSAAVEVDGKKVYRIMYPEYAARSCLACHGAPRGARDITGGRKEGQREGDLVGALSWTFPAR
jgi:general secretion pathway protein A